MGGYPFGVFALEGWVADWGRGATPFGNHLRLQSVGASGAWRMQFNASLDGVLRAGLSQVRQTRSDDGQASRLAGTFGLGLGLALTLALAPALELAWDLTSSEGNHSGTVAAQAVTLGLRLRFSSPLQRRRPCSEA